MADDVNDFGFSMTTEENIKRTEKDNVQAIAEINTKTQIKLKRVKEKIWPLLELLKKDPHLDVIRWSNRVTVIDKLMQDIDTIITE